MGAESWILTGALVCNAAVILFIHLDSMYWKRRWKTVARHFDNRRTVRVLYDFIMAFEDGNEPEQMALVYDDARRIVALFRAVDEEPSEVNKSDGKVTSSTAQVGRKGE